MFAGLMTFGVMVYDKRQVTRFLNLQYVSVLLGLLIAQCLLFLSLIRTDDSGPLGGLVFFYRAAATVLAVLVHIAFLLFSKRLALFSVALLVSVIFWTVAWISYDYLERTKDFRERAHQSGQILESRELGRSYAENLLRKKNMFFTWLPDSLCFKVFRDDGTFYYLTPGGKDGDWITVFETTLTKHSLSDTANWFNGLKNIIPLLDNKQLILLNKSLKEKSFCLSRAYNGYSSAYPCWRTVVTQTYDSVTPRFTTTMRLTY